MKIRKFKKILAKVLIVMLIIPNLNVAAETAEDSIQIQEEVTEDSIVVEESVEINEHEPVLVNDTEVIEGSLVGQEYKTKTVNIPFVETNNEDLAERIEYKLKMEALSTMTILETKTDSRYEIALAHEDGTFTYVNSAESIDEALKGVKDLEEDIEEDPEGVVDKLTNMSSRKSSIKLRSLNTENLTTTSLPTVISNNGQVVYSTNSMARIIKYINGEPYLYADKTTNLYSSEGLTNAVTYINQMYVDDAPILQDAGTAARIMVSGVEAWINKNTSSSEYDMIVVPLNQVKNPSYYIVINGELRHFISSNVTGTSGYTISVGKAPSYLAEGVKYFSYDGVYFYNGQNVESGLNTLISDYKSSTRVNAINSEKPFYLYYNYLPFRSRTVYTAAELDKFIEANTESTSKLRRIGSALKSSEENYGVNAVLTLGVAINESGWGMSTIAQSKNNLFGLNAIDSNPGQAADTYASPSASVIEFTKNYISRGYADPADWRYYGGFLGNKKDGINVRYASDPFWGEKASQFAYRVDKYLSGDISNLKDTNYYQLAMATTNNKVMKSDGSLLYNITNDKNQYAAYVNTPFVITKNTKVTVAGQTTYEINPERTTPLKSGGVANKFSGDYDWTIKGYVIDSDIKFLNEAMEVIVKPVSGVTLDKSTATLKLAESISLLATVAPQDASNKEVTWDSSNMAIATVDSTGKVTAVSAGTATITVTTKDGNKTASCKVTVTLPSPTSVKAVSSSYNSIKVSWVAVTGATGYEVYRSTSSTGSYSKVGTVTGTNYNNTELTINKTYYYKVRAYKTVGSSKSYSEYSSIVSAKPVLATPTLVKASATSSDSIHVTWEEVPGAMMYEVYTSTSNSGPYNFYTGTSQPWTESNGFEAGKTYYFKVRAYRTEYVGGPKNYSGFSSIVNVKLVLGVPTSVKAVTSSYNSIKTTWAAVNGATGYVVYRSTAKDGTYSKVGTATGKSYNNTGLTTNTTYYYKVRAYRTVGTTNVYSNYSSVVSAKPIPATPTSVKAVSSSYNSIKTTWAAVNGATGYVIYRSTAKDGTYSKVGTVTGTSYNNTGLTTNTTYYYKVRAYRTVGTINVYSNYSSVVSAKPIPATPGSVKAARASSTSIKVSWGKVAGASGYQVYRATSNTGTYSSVGTTTSLSYTNSKLTTGKTYYYKVRAYRTVGSTRVYGKWSSVVSTQP